MCVCAEQSLMMKCLYLVFVVFHVTAGCALSRDNVKYITQHQGGSVLLPCSCSDPRTKPQKFTWTTLRTGRHTKVFNDDQYSGRLQLFNNRFPSNLSLLITDLRVEDQGYYRCSTETEYRDIRIYSCALSGDNYQVVRLYGHEGDSVLLPCFCSDLHTKPQNIIWATFRTGTQTEVFNDEHYRGRRQLFNNISPGNLSLLISDLRKEDEGVYRCSTEIEYRDIRIYIKVDGKETSTRPKKPKPATEQPQSKTTHSLHAISSKTLEQNEQKNYAGFPLVFGSVAVVLLVILGAVPLICWRCRGGQCGKNVMTGGRPGYEERQKDQALPDVNYSTVSHVNTARASRVQINAEEKTEYACIITN